MSDSRNSALEVSSPLRGIRGGDTTARVSNTDTPIDGSISSGRPLLDLSDTSVESFTGQPLSPPIAPCPHPYKTILCTCCLKEIGVPVYCGDRFCPVCGRRRRGRVATRLRHLIRHAVHPPHHRLKMITLTIPNSTSPQAGCSLLVKSFRRLRSRRVWSNYVSGGAFVLEVTGRPGRWHCHLHMLVYARYIPVRSLSRWWSEVSPGKIVDIRLVSRDKAVSYLTKYLAKSSVPDNLRPDVASALRHFRLFQPFGTWFSVVCPAIRVPFPCPSCGTTSWLALDELSAMSRRAHRLSRSPPRRKGGLSAAQYLAASRGLVQSVTPSNGSVS